MATNENIRVVQLTDDNDNPVSPVVNVGSLYDKNGNKVDNLLSYKVAGTDVPVPEIKNVEAELTAKVDAKLAELDAAVTKLEKAAESGAKVTFTAKVKDGETVEKYMPVDVENGECYTGMTTGPIQQHTISGKIVSMIDYNTCVTVAISGYDVIANVVNLNGTDGVVTDSATINVPATKTGSSSRLIYNVFDMTESLACAIIYDPNSYEMHYIRVDISGKTVSISLMTTLSGKNGIIFPYKQNDHIIMASYAPVGGGGYTWYSMDTDTNTVSALKYGGNATYTTTSDMRNYDGAIYAISDTMALSTHYLYTITNGNVVVTSNNLGLYTYYKLCGCEQIGTNQYMLLVEMNGSSYTLYNAVITTSSASTKATLALTGSTSSSYSLDKAALIKTESGMYAVCKNLSTAKLVMHKISYTSTTVSEASSTDICSSNIMNGISCDTIYDGGGAFLLTNNAASYVGSSYNFILRQYKDQFYGSLTPASTGALALNNANAGETVELLYSGVVKDTDVSVGYRLDTKGFTAEAPVDGTLIVTRMSNEYNGQTEIVSYTGNNANGADNPCSITFSFAPKLIKLIGILAQSMPERGVGYIDSTNYIREVYVEPLTNSYIQYHGFMSNSSNTSISNSYAKFDRSTNTLYWYNTQNYSVQLNASGYTYYFLAIK